MIIKLYVLVKDTLYFILFQLIKLIDGNFLMSPDFGLIILRIVT